MTDPADVVDPPEDAGAESVDEPSYGWFHDALPGRLVLTAIFAINRAKEGLIGKQEPAISISHGKTEWQLREQTLKLSSSLRRPIPTGAQADTAINQQHH